MSEATPEVTPEPTPPVTPPPVQEPDNATIKAMRDQISNLEAARKELEAERDELKKAQMSEEEKREAELAELRTKAVELEALSAKATEYESQIEQIYQDELGSIPEALREKAEAASSSGTWAERLRSLRAAKGLITPEPVKVGTPTNPAGNGAPGKPVFDLQNIPEVTLSGKKTS